LFSRKKHRPAKIRRQREIPQTQEELTAHEKAYLEQLRQSIATPGRTPYIRRAPSRHDTDDSSVVKPLFDSGPLPAEQTNVAQSGKDTAQPSAKASRASLVGEDSHIRLGSDGIYEIDIDVPTADFEQYEEDRPAKKVQPAKSWPAPVAEATPSQPSVDHAREPEADQESAKAKGLFPPGTLVVWNGNQLGIYKEHLKKKGYDLLYVVEKDGRLQPKGICLFAYEPQPVGCLSEGIFQWMEQTMRWDRNALAVHFSNPEDLKKISALREPVETKPPEAEPKPPDGSPDDKTLVRGRTFTITVGRHKWNGVYWGRDTIGTIVAHNTNRAWSLMHLDLERFGASVKFGAMLARKKLREIEAIANGQG